MELGEVSIGEIGASGMTVSVLACNPSLLPVTVEGVEADLGSSQGASGSLDLGGASLAPLSSGTLQGSLQFSDFGSMKSFVGAALGSAPDPDFYATVKVDERVLGVFPYLQEKKYSMDEFAPMIFGQGQWSCNKQSLPGDARGDLSLAWARMSAAGLLYSDKGGLNSTNSTSGNTP